MEKFNPKPGFLVGTSIEAARKAEQRVRELFGRYPTLVAEEVANLIAQREGIFALKEYVERRISGRANDNSSQQPGLTAYLTRQGCEIVVEMCKLGGYPIADTQIEEVTPDLVALRLPRGIYNMGRGNAKFYLEAEADWEQSREANKPFALGYNDVVRIEGDAADEFWQNVNYNGDGTKIESDEPWQSG